MAPISRRFLTLAVGVALPLAARAVSLPIFNPSFENPASPPATFTGGMTFGPANWTVYNTGATDGFRYFGVWNPTTTDSFDLPIPDGSNVGVVFLQNTFSLAEAGLQQILSSTLQLSTHYTLSVEVGNFDPGASTEPFDFTGFPGYRVDLLAGSTVIASDNNTLQPAEGQFLTSIVSVSIGATHVNAGQPLAIRLVNLNGPGIEVNFDRVVLDAVPVPEPSTAILSTMGALMALKRRRSH
jgi:hapalindole H/12-epi-hapalindole U/12-epi-fischerindole U synthase